MVMSCAFASTSWLRRSDRGDDRTGQDDHTFRRSDRRTGIRCAERCRVVFGSGLEGKKTAEMATGLFALDTRAFQVAGGLIVAPLPDLACSTCGNGIGRGDARVDGVARRCAVVAQVQRVLGSSEGFGGLDQTAAS